MTHMPRRLVAEEARSLQLRLSHGRVDPITATTEACRIFSDAADTVRAHWLGLELHGYTDLVDTQPLHVVLGVPANNRLAGHVAAYRTKGGVEASNGVGHRPAIYRMVPQAARERGVRSLLCGNLWAAWRRHRRRDAVLLDQGDGAVRHARVAQR